MTLICGVTEAKLDYLLCSKSAGQQGMEKYDGLVQVPDEDPVHLHLGLQLRRGAVPPLAVPAPAGWALPSCKIRWDEKTFRAELKNDIFQFLL